MKSGRNERWQRIGRSCRRTEAGEDPRLVRKPVRERLGSGSRVDKWHRQLCSYLEQVDFALEAEQSHHVDRPVPQHVLAAQVERRHHVARHDLERDAKLAHRARQWPGSAVWRHVQSASRHGKAVLVDCREATAYVAQPLEHEDRATMPGDGRRGEKSAETGADHDGVVAGQVVHAARLEASSRWG